MASVKDTYLSFLIVADIVCENDLDVVYALFNVFFNIALFLNRPKTERLSYRNELVILSDKRFKMRSGFFVTRGNEYPPVISAIRKIAVSGACITPAISPAIPTSTKFVSGKITAPHRLTVLATTKPNKPPIKSVGPKVPPTPPPALVKDIEKTFVRNTIRKNSGITHGFMRYFVKNEVPIASTA